MFAPLALGVSLQCLIDFIHGPHGGRVLARFQPREGFLPHSDQLGQLHLRQPQRPTFLDDVARDGDLDIFQRRSIALCVGRWKRWQGRFFIGQSFQLP